MTLLTTADLPESLRPDPIRLAVRKAVRDANVNAVVRRIDALTGMGACMHDDAPLRGVRCPECVAEAFPG